MAPSHVNQGARYGPDHIPQEPVRHGGDVDGVAIALDIQPLHSAYGIASVGAGSSERPEIMLANEERCSPPHLCYVQGSAVVIDVAVGEWRHDVAVPNPVAIGLAPGREPGMEATVNELGLQDSNVAVQVAVNGVAQLKRADVAGEPEAGYLPVGVDSGVGAA